MKNKNYFQHYISKMEYFNYSKHTIKIYTHYLREFIDNLGVYPSKLSSKDFQSYIDSYQFTSISKQNQVISSLKLFYEKVLNKKYVKIDFQRPRKEYKQPKIIDYNMVSLKISEIKNLKHKSILAIPFTTGLRVSELLNLKIKDIDSNRMIINVYQGKGKKDRIVPLSEDLLILLRKYFLLFNPKEYLFNGQFSNKYSASSCNKLIKKYIDNSISMHVLRHTYLTFLADNNISLKTIQDIAGHKNSKTTEIYIHLSTNTLKSVPSPKLGA